MIQGTRKLSSILAAFLLVVATFVAVPASVLATSDDDGKTASAKARIEAPLNLAVLIQDDLVSKVGNELDVTRDFIRSLPQGSRVMVGYITSGSLQVRQPFTEDLDKAARSLRLPLSSDFASAYNPYVEVVEALKKFDGQGKNRNEANRRSVTVYSFYAPSVGLTSRSNLLAGYGQSSLNRLSNETGGRAFFQGTNGFVTFDGYFNRLREALNEQLAKAY
jgi:hypothetical protein